MTLSNWQGPGECQPCPSKALGAVAVAVRIMHRKRQVALPDSASTVWYGLASCPETTVGLAPPGLGSWPGTTCFAPFMLCLWLVQGSCTTMRMHSEHSASLPQLR